MLKIKAIVLFLLFLSSFKTTSAQLKVPAALKQIKSKNGQPSIEEMGLGIKEALQAGLVNSSARLSAVNGFLNDPAIKIQFPSEAQKAEKMLRGMGFNSLCDNVISSLNRAAEEAVKEALPIFTASLKQMSLNDASGILLSKEKNAATQYFKTATSIQLAEKFKPVIQSSLDKAGASKHWTAATSQYNKIPMTGKINTDLSEYVTQKALFGLFQEVAKEELKIRESNIARTSPLLQKVFAYAETSK